MINVEESGGIVVGGGVEPDKKCNNVLPLSTRDECAKGLFAKATVQ